MTTFDPNGAHVTPLDLQRESLRRHQLNTMTPEKWDELSRAQQAKLRDLSGLTPQLTGLEGFRVEVLHFGTGERERFIVSRSTGWRPCHICLARRNSTGGPAALKQYAHVRKLEWIRKYDRY